MPDATKRPLSEWRETEWLQYLQRQAHQLTACPYSADDLVHTCLIAFYDHHRCYPWQHPEPAHALRWCAQKLRALACDAYCSARGYLPDLRAKFVEFFGYDPSSRASESLIRAEGKTAPSDDRGGDTDEGNARIGERLGDDTEHAAG